MEGDRIARVEEIEFGIEEADLAVLAFHLEIDVLPSSSP
jgi:hypothetical protein